MGSLAEGVPQTPTSFQTQGTPATLPDTGIGHDDDVVSVVSRHELKIPMLIEQRRWRSVYRLQAMLTL